MRRSTSPRPKLIGVYISNGVHRAQLLSRLPWSASWVPRSQQHSTVISAFSSGILDMGLCAKMFHRQKIEETSVVSKIFRHTELCRCPIVLLVDNNPDASHFLNSILSFALFYFPCIFFLSFHFLSQPPSQQTLFSLLNNAIEVMRPAPAIYALLALPLCVCCISSLVLSVCHRLQLQAM